MKSTNIVSATLLTVCISLLSGCSMFGDKDKVADASGASATMVETAAAGTEGNAVNTGDKFNGTDNNLASNKKAPYSDTYHFAFDNSVLSESDKQELQKQGGYLLSHSNAQILLAGHTDERGSREYNVALGERRAQAAAEFLRVLGVKSSQIRLVSYGQEKPFVLIHNEAGWAKNRRVELNYEAKA